MLNVARLGALVALSLLAFVPAASAKVNSLPTFQRSFTWLQTCNDWQSTPTNCVTDTPTANGGQPCVWGDEDELYDSAYGRLSAGQSISDTLCIITDPCNDGACPHIVVWQTSGNVTARVTATTGSWSGAQGCFADPLWPQTIFPALAGTNGGVGYLTKYTLTVTAKKNTQMFAGFDITSTGSDGKWGYYRQLFTVPCPGD